MKKLLVILLLALAFACEKEPLMEYPPPPLEREYTTKAVKENEVVYIYESHNGVIEYRYYWDGKIWKERIFVWPTGGKLL